MSNIHTLQRRICHHFCHWNACSKSIQSYYRARFRDIPFEFSAIGKEIPGFRNHHQKSPSETSWETSSSYKTKLTLKYVTSHRVKNFKKWLEPQRTTVRQPPFQGWIPLQGGWIDNDSLDPTTCKTMQNKHFEKQWDQVWLIGIHPWEYTCNGSNIEEIVTQWEATIAYDDSIAFRKMKPGHDSVSSERHLGLSNCTVQWWNLFQQASFLTPDCWSYMNKYTCN